MNEAETRAEHIDPALNAAGWGMIAGSRIRREFFITPGRIEGHGKRGKALKADYVFTSLDGPEEFHDRSRGVGAFAPVLPAIRKIIKKKI